MGDSEERARDASGRFASQEDGDDEQVEASGANDEDAEASANAEDGGASEDNDAQAGDKDKTEDLSDTTAPSIGPHTTFERDTPEERLARHEQSDTDAMGLDKRRAVVGGQYGASAAKQATLYGAALLVMALVVVGFILLAGELDQPPETIEEQAPWSMPEARQVPPAPLQ